SPPALGSCPNTATTAPAPLSQKIGGYHVPVLYLDYYELLLRGELDDPTLTAQMRVGFEPRALLADYLDDPVCANYGILIVLPAEKNVPFEREQRSSAGQR
ncbi:MAG: hypothetical protein PWP23_3163, partial [Candidatus Sumerlaeota bacterium]|nr:hypothetical protein [Candidatus Sumerlaeota bacterium]